MDARTKIGILLIVYAVQVTVSAPTTWTSSLDSRYFLRRSEDKETGRIFWSAVGDILEALPFLPFTVNVPDAVSSMWNFFTGFFRPGGASTGRPTKKPTKNSTAEAEPGITRDDLIDYFLY